MKCAPRMKLPRISGNSSAHCKIGWPPATTFSIILIVGTSQCCCTIGLQMLSMERLYKPCSQMI